MVARSLLGGRVDPLVRASDLADFDKLGATMKSSRVATPPWATMGDIGGTSMDAKQLIHDWNDHGAEPPRPDPANLMLDDETLRDGLQSPSVIDPDIEAKKKILHLQNRLSIDTANIGLPGAGPRAEADVEALCREIVDSGLAIRPNCAARTMIKAGTRSSWSNSPRRRFAIPWTRDYRSCT